MKKMTKPEFDAETVRIEVLIALANAGKGNPNLSLAEKVTHNRERNLLQEVLRQHKLNYFELVAAKTERNPEGTISPSGPVNSTTRSRLRPEGKWQKRPNSTSNAEIARR